MIFSRRTLRWLPLLCLSLASCRATTSSIDPGLEQELQGALRKLEESYRSGDLLGVADAYADDALILEPDGRRIRGRQAVDAFWSDIAEPVEWRIETWQTGGDGNTAYQTGRSWRSARTDGVARTAVVDFLILWQRHADRGWQIAVESTWEAAGD